MTFRRLWDGKDWERFSRRLVQLRHGAANVQNVPDAVRGDAGIEFFTLDGCCYQSYAPQEVSDIAKAASAMKRKAGQDLPKLIKNRDTVQSLLGDIRITRWMLLCPFLDDKSVIAFVREKELEVRGENLPFVHPDFRALVHCDTDFDSELELLRNASTGVPLAVTPATDVQVSNVANDIHTRVRDKLRRGHPDDDDQSTERRTRAFIRSELTSANLLQSLRRDYPDLWERARRTIDAEEQRLDMIGAGTTNNHLTDALVRLEQSLKTQLPSMTPSDATILTNGVVGSWLIECPLDFKVSS